MPLEHTPLDVLQHIALITVSDTPSDLSRLLATSRSLYNSLNIRSNPHLYAAIFKLKYNPAPSITASALAAELVHRCRALRRVRRLDMSLPGLRQDLWTLLFYVAESGCSETGFPEFIIQLARHYLRKDVRCRKEIKTLVVWLLCLALRRQDILAQTPEVWSALVVLLRPFVSTTAAVTSPSDALFPRPVFGVAMPHFGPPLVAEDDSGIIMRYNIRMQPPELPAPSDAAIIVIFSLKEAVCLQVPSHLPATRAIALSENRSGPTAEDYAVFINSATYLFADMRAAVPLDPWIAHVLNSVPPAILGDPPQANAMYSPGTLTGIWQGSLMVGHSFIGTFQSLLTSSFSLIQVSTCVPLANPEPVETSSDFLCRAPMQCQFDEYFCFSPCVPLPLDMSSLPAVRETRGTNKEVNLETPSGESFSYRKFLGGQDFSSPALDRVLIGQTLRDHEDAWIPGGFIFTGRVHDTGLISFTRRPKDDESELAEAWIFEGRLCYGTALVGTFRSSSDEAFSAVRGIFSMRKVE
ncbi:hypothetical protein FB45DRAFT_1067902 [Roridomyces roridus]|uniref:F-box domain-containing protein n=1 Tax=Roridomyces roridus TaxID=1738132 RepID=A0AAD7B0S9_9AGAR|nr:hypothetical protein FB45DRAFT_1067902 [Roridomyces roridus]